MTPEDFFSAERAVVIYGPQVVLFNIALAFILGMLISHIYKVTHKGLSYSQSFMLTIVFVSVITGIVIMIIGNNLARAFALVGALSIIRFRTVIKDTKDTAFIFLGLAAGMAAGTSSYFLAVSGTISVSIIALALHFTNYGSLYKSEFILRFRTIIEDGEPDYIGLINKLTKSNHLLHVEPAADGLTNKLTFDITLRKEHDPQELASKIGQLDGISEVILIASNSDVDY